MLQKCILLLTDCGSVMQNPLSENTADKAQVNLVLKKKNSVKVM